MGAAKELELPSSVISQCYMSCVEEVNEIWRSLTSSIHDVDEENVKEVLEEELTAKSAKATKTAKKPAAKTTAKKTASESTTKKKTE